MRKYRPAEVERIAKNMDLNLICCYGEWNANEIRLALGRRFKKRHGKGKQTEEGFSFSESSGG